MSERAQAVIRARAYYDYAVQCGFVEVAVSWRLALRRRANRLIWGGV